MNQQDLADRDESGGNQNSEKITPICPACGSKLTRRSRRRTWQDRLKSVFGRWPYRCDLCSTRFLIHHNPDAIAHHNAEAEKAVRVREEQRNIEDGSE